MYPEEPGYFSLCPVKGPTDGSEAVLGKHPTEYVRVSSESRVSPSRVMVPGRWSRSKKRLTTVRTVVPEFRDNHIEVKEHRSETSPYKRPPNFLYLVLLQD